MKKLILSSILSAAAISASAAPLVTIGDQLDLFFRGAVTGKWDSNITYASSNKIDDYSAVFRLGAEADYGRNSKFKANVKFFEDITRYASKKEFNSNLAKVFATASYTETSLTVTGDFSFVQNFQNTSTTTLANQAGELVRYNEFNAGVMLSYDFTEKVFGELGGRWSYTEYLGNWAKEYADLSVYSIPVSLLYRITPKISAGLSYQYRNNEFSGGSNMWDYLGNSRDDHFGGATLRGELLPKLTATLYGGVTYRSSSGGLIKSSEDNTMFSFSGSLGYELTEKVGLFLRGYRDFGNGASRESSINTGCEIGANYMITEFVTSVASFSYQNAAYELDDNRADDQYIGRIGLEYIPNKFFVIGANYRFLANCSNIDTARYNQHLVDISVTVKY